MEDGVGSSGVILRQPEQEVETMAGCGCGTKTAKTAKAPDKKTAKKAK
jgi:hypothetical protein